MEDTDGDARTKDMAATSSEGHGGGHGSARMLIDFSEGRSSVSFAGYGDGGALIDHYSGCGEGDAQGLGHGWGNGSWFDNTDGRE